jgi:hypothetical protein
MKKSVTVALYGGLGNQLFQYATGLAMAKHYGASLVLDLSWFDSVHGLQNTTIRNFALRPFAIQAELKTGEFPALSEQNIFKRLVNKILRRIGLDVLQGKIFTEKKFRFDPEIFHLNCPIWLNGYWQSPKYFENLGHDIHSAIGRPQNLSAESAAMLEKISAAQSICAHVRRGDYVTNQQASETHGLCNLDYYKQGIHLVSADLSNPHCFVFSDDPQWVRENFDVGIPITVVDINDADNAHQDLWLMAACRRFVIANSSLSWWGAWLGRNPCKKVVAPKQWFMGDARDTRDLIPDGWIRL